MIALFSRKAPMSPELEEMAGKAMLALARREGHRKALPAKPLEIPQRPDRKAIIAKAIRDNGPMTALQIMGATGMGRSQVSDHARLMVESGTLRSVKVSGGTLRYHLADGATIPDITPRQQRRLDVLRAMVGAGAVRASEIATPLGLHRVQVRDVLYIALRDGEVEKAPIEGWPAYRLTMKGIAAISTQAEAA